MPTRPAKACRCGGVRVNDVCNRCGKGYGRKRATAAQRGYNADWRKARRLFLKDNPFCVVCGSKAVIVDHRVPHRGDMRLFWDRSNWQSMCKRHHDMKTGSGQ